MQCAKDFVITVELDCDTFSEATWVETIVDADSSAVYSMAAGDGAFFVALTGAPGHSGSWYRYVSNAMTCSVDYDATVQIDYSINLTDVGGGSNAESSWQVRRNGVLIINTNKVAPNAGNLTEMGTLSSGPITMLANVAYTFQIDYLVIAIGAGTSSNVSGVIRFRPLSP